MKPVGLRAFVDRLEGDKAVLLLGEEEHDTAIVPAKYLPEAAGEGAVLTLRIRYEPELTAKAAQEIKGLIGDLRKRSTD